MPVTVTVTEDAAAAHLNDCCEDLQSLGVPPQKAMDMTADQHRLTLIADDGECCRIYRSPYGLLLNCWYYAPGDRIIEGELGFDDQVEWYTERETEKEEEKPQCS